MMEEFLTAEEVAARLKVKARTVQQWLRTGRLPGVKLGQRWRIRASDVVGFLGLAEVEGGVAAVSGRIAESQEERRARVMAAAGCLAGLPGSVDQFLARKQEDLNLEEERWSRIREERPR